MCSLRSNFLRKFIPRRCFHTTQVQRIDTKSVEEVKIPVPWGHVAGKWWGCRKTQPIIATHGLYDNACSYDNLMPLLNAKSVLCLDFPGHGFSSHFPKGLCINYDQYVFVLRYIFSEYFKWKKISLLCHSYGSSMGFTYAGYFPDHVARMVNMDCSRLGTASVNKNIAYDFRNSTDGFIQDFESDDGQGFSWEETISTLSEGRVKFGFPLTRKSCEIVARRGTVKISDNKYRFTHDKRLKYWSLGRPTWTMISGLTERITCDVLNISPKDGFLKIYSKTQLVQWHENVEKLGKTANLKHVVVEGNHHAHLETPENVAPILNDFFKD